MKDENKTKSQLIYELRKIRRRLSELESPHAKAEQNRFIPEVLESLDHPFYVIDANDYTVQPANKVAMPDKLPKKATCYAITHNQSKPCNEKNHICPLKEIKKTKRPVIVEHVHYDKKGNPRYVEVHAFPIIDNKKKVTQMIEYCLDITDRKQVEGDLKTAIQQSRESEERFKTIFKNANDIIMYVDLRGTIIDINEKLEDTLGFKPEEVIGKNFAKTGAVYLRDLPKLVKLFFESVRKRRVLGGGTANIMELELRHKNGNKVLLESNTSIIKKNGKIKGFLNVLRDITERKQTGLRMEKEFAAITSVVDNMLSGEMDEARTEKRVLDTCLAATDSIYGMIGKINDHGKFDITTYSIQTLQDCAFPEALTWEMSTGMTIRGIWGWAMKHGKPIICNNLKKHPDRVGYPKGHVEIGCFLGVPLKREGKAVGMVAVANKQGGYTQKDRETLIRLSSVMSVSQQHQQALTAAKRTSRELEQLVKERTSALTGSEERWRSLVENAPAIIMTLDRTGIIQFINYTVPGLKAEQVIGKSVKEYTLSEHVETIFKALEKVFKTGKPQEYEVSGVGPHGQTSHYSTRIGPIKQKGKVVSAIQITTDVTKRKQAEEALRNSESKFRGIFECDMIGTLFWDANGDITDANDAFFKIVGYTRDDFKSGKLRRRDLTPPEYTESDNEKLKELAEKGVLTPFEKEYIHKSGRRIPIILGAATFPGDTQSSVAFILDITDRKRMEMEREQLTFELAQKNKELEQIVYVASHDLRSPLVNIQGFSRELGRAIDELAGSIQANDIPQGVIKKVSPIIREDVPESLKYIDASILKMDTLLKGLLRLSRIGRLGLKTEELNMDRLLDDVVKTFEFRIKEADIKMEISDLPSCRGDVSQINQVFSNLVDNAIKFLDPDRPGKIRISGGKKERQSVYCIEDNGIGMAKDHQAKIFEIFHQFNPRSIQGEGLGLAIVKRILDKHNGAVRVESEPGTGTRFYVTLPG